MTWKVVLFVSVLLITPLSGCYVEPGSGTSLEVDGHPNASETGFSWEGQVRLSGGIPTEEVYEDIHVEFYAENGSLIYKERLGTLHNRSERLNVSVSLSVVPYYVVFDSQDIWDGDMGVPYYVRSKTGHQGYQIHYASDRSELPITPDG